jgi:hypothetical protein
MRAIQSTRKTMATINISDLHPTGSDLFSDSEGYMSELSDGEFDTTYGGLIPALLWSVAVAGARISSVKCASYAAGGVAVVGAGVAGWITGGK